MSTTAVVLIVEQDPDRREALREHLSGRWCLLEAAGLGEAREAMEPSPPHPDLILSDLRGSDQHSLTLYRRLRADPNLKATPVLLLVPPVEPDGPSAEEAGETGPVLPESVTPDELRRLVGHHLATEGIMPGLPAAPEAPLPERIEAVVEARLGDPDFTAGALARAVGLSRRQLTRRVKEALGTTPAAYVRARRLERAKELLAAGPDTVTAVAAAVGFASPSAFSKAFREHVGTAPSDYAGPPAG